MVCTFRVEERRYKLPRHQASCRACVEHAALLFQSLISLVGQDLRPGVRDFVPHLETEGLGGGEKRLGEQELGRNWRQRALTALLHQSWVSSADVSENVC